MSKRCVLDRLIQLLSERSFVHRHTTRLNSGQEYVLYNYGPPGALLRLNIVYEWRRNALYEADNGECFLTENSTFSHDVNKLENVTTAADNLRTGLLSSCLDHYLEVFKQVNRKPPFSIAQTGVCCRPKVTPGEESRFLLDSCENTNLTTVQFCLPGALLMSFNNCQRRRLQWWRQYARSPSNFHLSDPQKTHVNNESFQSFSVQYQFPWGWDTVENIVNWGDYPLKQLKNTSNASLLGKLGRTVFMLSVIESTVILERAFLAFLLDSFQEKAKLVNKAKSTASSITRNLLKLHSKLVPYKIGVAVSGNKITDIRLLAHHIIKELKGLELQVLSSVDTVSSLKGQCSTHDQIGIPFTVVVNDVSLETGLVVIRSRDTTLQEQIHVSMLKEHFTERFS